MKFKALAAAVALLSSATVAHAEWHDGVDEATLYGDGELLLVAFDDVRKVSVIQDLGGSYVEMWENFQSTTFNKSFALDSLFASTFAGSQSSDIQWSVFANNYGYTEFDGYNEPARFSNGYMITTNSTNPTDNGYTNVQDKISGGLSSKVNSQLGMDGNYAANGAFYGDAGNALYAGGDNIFGAQLLQTVNFNTTATADESLFFWAMLTPQEANGALAGTAVKANGYWALDIGTGTVQYTATPVPAAIWLLASGLLGLGAVSRRRKA